MADDNNARYPIERSLWPRGRRRRRRRSDPLAELARLIGQNDPFAEFGRDRRAAGAAGRRRAATASSTAAIRTTIRCRRSTRRAGYRAGATRHSSDYGQDLQPRPRPRLRQRSGAAATAGDRAPRRDSAPAAVAAATQLRRGSPSPPQSYQPREPFRAAAAALPPAPGFDPPAYADQRPSALPGPASGQSSRLSRLSEPERPPFDPPPSFLTADRSASRSRSRRSPAAFAQPPLYPHDAGGRRDAARRTTTNSTTTRRAAAAARAC